MLTHDAAFNLWFDSFREQEMDGHDVIDDGVWMRVVTHMETAYDWHWRIGREMLFSAVEYVCRKFTRNPVQDYVKALKWDGCPRIDRWLLEVCNVEDLPIHRTYSRKWCVGLMHIFAEVVRRSNGSALLAWLSASHLHVADRSPRLGKEHSVARVGELAGAGRPLQ
jgi:hypothetical protein